MMALLRSRRTMLVLVGLVVVGMVATGAVGLINALNAPDPQGADGGQSAAPPRDAPPVGALGGAPDPVDYVDLDQECGAVAPGRPEECYRTVGLDVGEEDLDAAGALEEVRGALLDDGWQPLVPSSDTDPDEVPAEEFVLTDGTVMAMASPVSHDDSTPAAVVLAHY
ncbi:hypothetical protein [Nocardiopsis potens]|uniref:hypothetical protein n=1 Tax=Nocardiopsis potens TaxID=1246458 RepID=UPI000347C3E6|nr:hypothetical protein [Nocardiopsis potens]